MKAEGIGLQMKLPIVHIKKILYATDLSENAVHAFAYAASLASMCHAGITTLHVLTEFSGEEFITNMINTDTLQQIRDRHYAEARTQMIGRKRDKIAVKEILEAFYEQAMADDEIPNAVSDDVLIKSGAPAEVIVQTAEEMHCDLIVMGTRGQGIIADFLIGSTAKWVLRHSPIPVLIVRLPENG
jgi:nucleotide-binding universal stress UspA family protein